MKIIGVIPARYASTRLPGKLLADIHGKPMIWWVYNNIKRVSDLSALIVAADDDRIIEICNLYEIPSMRTSIDCDTPTVRVWEVSTRIEGDIFIFVGGDEPLITPEAIDLVTSSSIAMADDFYVSNAMTTINNASEVIDFTNIKIVSNTNGDGLYCSRSPIPYPKGSLNFKYKKFVGICAMSKDALDFYVSTPKSKLEKIEECDLIRFIEHHKKIKFVDVNCDTLSVDTQKDLDQVRKIIKSKIDNGLLST